MHHANASVKVLPTYQNLLSEVSLISECKSLSPRKPYHPFLNTPLEIHPDPGPTRFYIIYYLPYFLYRYCSFSLQWHQPTANYSYNYNNTEYICGLQVESSTATSRKRKRSPRKNYTERLRALRALNRQAELTITSGPTSHNINGVEGVACLEGQFIGCEIPAETAGLWASTAEDQLTSTAETAGVWANGTEDQLTSTAETAGLWTTSTEDQQTSAPGDTGVCLINGRILFLTFFLILLK